MVGQSAAALAAHVAGFEHVAGAVITTDLDFKIVGWNPGAEALYGWRASEVVGSAVRDVLRTEYFGSPERVVGSLFTDGHWAGEVVHHDKDGQSHCVYSSVSLVRDDQGDAVATIAVNHVAPDNDTWPVLAGHIDGALEASATATFSWDPATDRFEWSDNAGAVHARSQATMGATSSDALQLVHPDDQARVLAETTDALGRTDGYEIEYRIVGDDGEVRWLYCRGRILRDEDTRTARVLGTVVDVTDRHRTLTALRETAARLGTIVSNAPIVVFAFDAEGRTTLLEGAGTPPRLAELGEAVIGSTVEELTGGDPELVGYVQRALGGESFRVDVDFDGRTFDAWYQPLRDDAGDVVGGFGVATDVTDRRNAEVELAHRAVHDPLTGLPNRVLFFDRLDVALARGKRRGMVTAVLFLDLDRFKLVNDTYGHGVGDEVLRQAATRLSSLIRPADTIARFGGDEFVVLCEDLVGELEAVGIAERIAEGLRLPLGLADDELYLSTSIGIAVARGTGDRPQDLIRDADVAMYRAKEHGRSRWELFDEHMREWAVEQLDLRSALHGALERDELRLHFQPAVSLRDGALHAVEALLRWQHPVRGLVGPDEFIPVAEDEGLMGAIGEWVLRQACEQLGRWNRIVHPPLVVAVNVSGRQLSAPGLVDNVAKVLAETGTDPRCLCLEVGESALSNDENGDLGEVLGRLRDLGVRLAVDDFGAGQAALATLARVPIDVLKLDKALADGLDDGERGTAVVRAMVELGHALGLVVVAEGVETAGQLAALEEAGCDAAQGFLLGRPVAPDWSGWSRLPAW